LVLASACAPEDGAAAAADEPALTAQGALANGEAGDDDGPAAVGRGRCPRALPAALNPPPDATLISALPARGVQIYTCAASTTGAAAAWTLKAPHAVLMHGGEVAAIHFAGPSWQAIDGSLVVGARVAAAPAPDPTAIPWLLLRAASNAGVGVFTDVTFIQRLSTEGGVAPATGCDDAHLGAEVLVPYQADYFFYRTAIAGARVRQCVAPPPA